MDVNLLKKVDFGEIDGYGDPNLEKYFLDNDYWKKIIDSKVFYVVGKKGTGKSSIYRMLEKEAFHNGSIVINKDFGEFPFEKLLKLPDDDFAKPNQYQTIWKNVIFNLFVQTISKISYEDESNEYYQQIVKYSKLYLGDATDLHKDVITKTEKLHGNLVFKGMECGSTREMSSSYSYSEDNITRINSTLCDLIVNFLITTSSETKIIIQFDRLDDNYNQYQNVDEYYQAIISLFKSVYSFNQLLRSKSINNAKVILYIRSDIMKAIATRDSESARWDDYRYDLQWNVNNMRDINSSDLKKMIDLRIHTSACDLKHMCFKDIFEVEETVLRNCGINRNGLFGALVLQTLFRPRDLIKLSKSLQEEIIHVGEFNSSVYKSATKKYANWLVNTEIANEINPILGDDYKYVIELLRLCGSRNLSVRIFNERYKAIKHDFKFSSLELLEFLYSVGIIENTWKDRKTGKYMHRSIFRNEGEFDRNLQLRILPAVWNGLTV